MDWRYAGSPEPGKSPDVNPSTRGWPTESGQVVVVVAGGWTVVAVDVVVELTGMVVVLLEVSGAAHAVRMSVSEVTNASNRMSSSLSWTHSHTRARGLSNITGPVGSSFTRRTGPPTESSPAAVPPRERHCDRGPR